MQRFEPDYTNVVLAARNKVSPRLPLYEHIISAELMEAILEEPFAELYRGDLTDKRTYFTTYCRFFREMGYDTVSYECCIGEAMPGSGALEDHADPVIKTRKDFETYPWDEIPELYFKAFAQDYELLRSVMPAGMKAVGGPGNGIFECVQELTGYEGLCYLAADDPEIYAAVFKKVGDVNLAIWRRFMQEYGDVYCVLRFGDDLGYKSNTLLSAADIRAHIVPQYKRIIDLVHGYDKPFLLHSCGAIFDVMEDMIAAGIDAKHSNEDQIAPFYTWVELYGDRIGNFGGIDTDAVCRLDKDRMTAYIKDVVQKCYGHGGFAFGSGNSIPGYVPAEQYWHMNQTVRHCRRE